jgi:outer membrane murein-binding lipoprotein Lpp
VPAHSSPQTAHLHALQHEISLKTLALQTLQHEQTTLLQTLERQRTKSLTLEHKARVRDVEINTLSDEKDKLVGHVSTLNTQVEELQQSRDEARHQLVANGAQYMRIMEMANRLQAQGAADAKTWDTEKSALERRIRLLAGATEHSSLGESESISTTSNSSSSQTETITVLRAEVVRLRARMQSLELAMHGVRRESRAVKEAARRIVETSGILEGLVGGMDG